MEPPFFAAARRYTIPFTDKSLILPRAVPPPKIMSPMASHFPSGENDIASQRKLHAIVPTTRPPATSHRCIRSVGFWSEAWLAAASNRPSGLSVAALSPEVTPLLFGGSARQ